MHTSIKKCATQTQAYDKIYANDFYHVWIELIAVSALLLFFI